MTSPQGRRRQLRQPGTGALGSPVSPLPGAAIRCAPTDVRPHSAAVNIYEAQHPLVAEFAGRLAQDHAKQEFTDCSAATTSAHA